MLEHELRVELGWYRLAMTGELAAARGIVPIRKTDGRNGQAHDAIEVESLGQAELVALLRATLEGLAPEPLEDVLERERVEQEHLAAYLARYEGTR